MTDAIRRGAPPRAHSPVFGGAAPEVRVPVPAPAELEHLKHLVRDQFSSERLARVGVLAKMPPSLERLLAPGVAVSGAPDASRFEAAIEHVARLLEGGAIGESGLGAVRRASAQIDAVLAVRENASMLSREHFERLDALLLAPLERLQEVLQDASTRVLAQVGERDEAALRARLTGKPTGVPGEPAPPSARRLDTLDLQTARFSKDPPSFAAPERYQRGDLVAVPRDSGPATRGVVVGHDPDGLRVAFLDDGAFAVTTLSRAALAAANPFRIGDTFEANGLSIEVLGLRADGTLRMLPIDLSRPDDAVMECSGRYAEDLATELVAARAHAARFTPTSVVPTDPATFARSAGGAVDAAYLQNAIEASALFSERFASAQPLVGESLQALCAAMHTVACVGSAGDRPFRGARYVSDRVGPGEVRTGDGVPKSTRPEAVAYAEAVGKAFGFPPLEDARVAVRGVPTPMAPMSFVNGLHVYPAGDELSVYFESAAAIMEPLRRAPPVPLGSRVDQRTIDRIADAYHVLINARPFLQVNNSLLMSQVNVLLQRAGHPPISHGWLDHLAHRLPADSFRVVFRAHLEGRLPTPEALGLKAP